MKQNSSLFQQPIFLGDIADIFAVAVYGVHGAKKTTFFMLGIRHYIPAPLPHPYTHFPLIELQSHKFPQNISNNIKAKTGSSVAFGGQHLVRFTF